MNIDLAKAINRRLVRNPAPFGNRLFVDEQAVLDAVPDGWAKIDGEWVQITSDGVGYGEFDRQSPGRTEGGASK